MNVDDHLQISRLKTSCRIIKNKLTETSKQPTTFIPWRVWKRNQYIFKQPTTRCFQHKKKNAQTHLIHTHTHHPPIQSLIQPPPKKNRHTIHPQTSIFHPKDSSTMSRSCSPVYSCLPRPATTWASRKASLRPKGFLRKPTVGDDLPDDLVTLGQHKKQPRKLQHLGKPRKLCHFFVKGNCIVAGLRGGKVDGNELGNCFFRHLFLAVWPKRIHIRTSRILLIYS